MILTGENRTIRRETCPSATLSTTNPTWTDLGVNQSLCSEKLAANCLSYGMVFDLGLICVYFKILGVKHGLLALQEHRLRIFKNIVLRRIFRPKRKEETTG
jgi:hypothetical protein